VSPELFDSDNLIVALFFLTGAEAWNKLFSGPYGKEWGMKHRLNILASVIIFAAVVLAFAAQSASASQRSSPSAAAADIPVITSFKVSPSTFKINRINLLKITLGFRDDSANLTLGYIIWSIRYDKAAASPGTARTQLGPAQASMPRLPLSGPLPYFFAFPFESSYFSRASGTFTFYASFLAENCEQLRFIGIRMYDKAGNVSADWPDVVLTREAGPAGEKQGYKVGQKAYDFTLFDKTNRKVTLSNYRGKVVLIDFSTTYCPACIEEAHHLEQLYQTYKNRGFIILSAISLNDQMRLPSPADLRLWASRNKMTFPVIGDPNYKVNSIYAGFPNVWEIPYNVIIDRQGRIALKVIGYDATLHKQIENKIKSLL
jgi:peroxiredoxin